mmetsp:Transcript_25497/g.65618  ORF Transcript_25497/g.65618 Transcript_25497/m.65618 type:complete len:94 (+) Transcript_25497:194-475(+)
MCLVHLGNFWDQCRASFLSAPVHLPTPQASSKACCSTAASMDLCQLGCVATHRFQGPYVGCSYTYPIFLAFVIRGTGQQAKQLHSRSGTVLVT